MNITDKQRKMFWAAAAVVGIIYFGPSIIVAVYQAFHPRPGYNRPAPQPRPDFAPAKPLRQAAPEQRLAQAASLPTYPPAPSAAYPAASSPASSPGVRYLPELTRLTGFWRGRVALVGRGTCDMRLELRLKDEPGKFTGYSSLTCVSLGPLVAKPSAAAVAVNQTDPEAAVLTGTPENDSIRFQVDKVVGTDSNGCAPTSFTVTPFGTNRIAVQWQEASCKGGEIILLKSPR